MKSRGGRKTKYTPETVDRFLQAIRIGATYDLAANYAGVHVSTIFDWINTKPEFSEQVKQARASAAIMYLATIEKAVANGDWRAASWKLKAMFPSDYGRDVVQHEGSASQPIRVEVVYREHNSD